MSLLSPPQLVSDGHSAIHVHHLSTHHVGFSDVGFLVDRHSSYSACKVDEAFYINVFYYSALPQLPEASSDDPNTVSSTFRLPKLLSSPPMMASPMAFGRDGAAVRKLRSMAGPRKSQILKTSTGLDSQDFKDDDTFIPSRPPPVPPLTVSANSSTGHHSRGIEARSAPLSEDLHSSGATSPRHSVLSDDDTHDWYDLKNSNNDAGPAGHTEQERGFSFRQGASKRFAEAWGISDKQFEDAAACREREGVARMWERHQLELTSRELPSRPQSPPVDGEPTQVQQESKQTMQRGDIVDGEWHPILRAQRPSVTQNTHRQADLRRVKTQGGIPTSMPAFHDNFMAQFQNNLRIEPQTRSSQSQGLHLRQGTLRLSREQWKERDRVRRRLRKDKNG